MWAFYAQNSGFAVGYNTEALRALGIDLRKVLYLEDAPVLHSELDNRIWVYLASEADQKEEARQGVQAKGLSFVQGLAFLELEGNWKNLANLLFLKAKSWAYEKEARLLVDQRYTRASSETCKDIMPMRFLDIPTEAIEKILIGYDTRPEDVRRIEELAEREKYGWELLYTRPHGYQVHVTDARNH